MDVPKSIEEMFSNLSEKNPNEIVAQIRKDLNHLIKKCILTIKDRPKDIRTIDRRGTHLFQPLLPFLMEHQFNVSALKLESLSDVAIIKKLYDAPEPNELIIAVDAINKGEEIEKVIEVLESLNKKVVKVVGYVIRKDTLNRLEANHPDTEFCFVVVAINDDDYNLVHQKLTAYYHSRLTPLDTDHIYEECEIGCKDKDELKEIIRESFLKIFDNEIDVVESEEVLFVDEKTNFKYSLELEYVTDIFRDLFLSDQEKRILDFERVQLRVRAKHKGSFYKLSSMAFCSPYILDVNDLQRLCPDETCDKNIPKDLVPNVCCRCLEQNFSSKLLERFKDKFTLVSKSRGYTVYWY
ncbi:MAG: hypothetical protein H0Z28_08025 [Archaeoglobus sp.]|nr:hypothetical protein [Archaeoglobus sp.]